MPRVSVLFDQGSAEKQEDGFVVQYPFYAVVDGVSANYCPEHPQQVFHGLTGGAMVARVFQETFYTTSSDLSLPACVNKVNHEVGRWQAQQGLSLESPEDLAGCVFAAAKIGEAREIINILYVGDSAAIWELNDGTIGITPNQVRGHDAVLVAEFKRIFRAIADDHGVNIETDGASTLSWVRAQTWDRYCAFSRAERHKNVNHRKSLNGYGVLNGSPDFGAMYHRKLLPLAQMKRLLLCTDGMVPWGTVNHGEEIKLAETLLSLYRKDGLPALLRNARFLEKEGARTSHTTGATEATAIAIEF